VLVATDVAARRIHVGDVCARGELRSASHRGGLHPSRGRTGRAGLSGLATTIVSGAEMIELRRFERTLKLKLERKEFGKMRSTTPSNMPIPSRTHARTRIR